ncbi:Calmodulin, partial [Globisporangium splendens]
MHPDSVGRCVRHTKCAFQLLVAHMRTYFMSILVWRYCKWGRTYCKQPEYNTWKLTVPHSDWVAHQNAGFMRADAKWEMRAMETLFDAVISQSAGNVKSAGNSDKSRQMVSPSSKRSANFANVREPEDNRHGDRKGEKRYNAPASGDEHRKQKVYSSGDDSKRLPKLEAHVRQALAAFRVDAHKNALPAASTIKECIAHIENASRDDTEIEVAEFRKCLFALGVSPYDTALLLDHFDKENSGFIDGMMLSNHLLASPSGSRNLHLVDEDNNTSGDVKHKLTPGKAATNSASSTTTSSLEERAMKDLHRKVIERVLLKSKTQNIKDALRQYDLDRTGYLTLPQFRTLARDHGFVGTEVERLIKFLDRANQGTISFHAFSGDVKLGANQAYPKSSPKKQQMAQPLTENGVSAIAPSPAKGKSSPVIPPESQDPMESVRAKLRQRVMGHNKSIREVFMEFDDDGNGYLDYEEFKRFVAKYNFTNDEACQVIDFLDRDFSGTIDYNEFSSGLLFYRSPPVAASTSSPLPSSHQVDGSQSTVSLSPQKAEHVLHDVKQKIAQKTMDAQSSKSSRTRLRDEFMKYGSEGKNGLDYQEFGAFLVGMGIKLKAEELSALLACIDVDGSEIIEFEEFRKLRDPKFDGDLDEDSSDGPSRDIADTRSKRDEKLLAVFNKYDIDGSGFFDYDEFAELMRDYGFSDADIMHTIKQVDQYKPSVDGLESILEIERELAVRMLQNTRDLRAAFRKYDLNGNGRLEYKEFRQVLRAYRFKEPEIRKVIRHLDRDVSGFIDYKEFIAGFSVTKENERGSPTGARKKSKYQVSRASNTGAPSSSKNHKSFSAMQAELSSVTIERLKKDLLTKILATYGIVQSVFRRYDEEQEGRLTEKQFETLVVDHGISRDDARLLLDAFDQDRSGSIEYEELLSQLVVRSAV